jgi:hypothetical protein
MQYQRFTFGSRQSAGGSQIMIGAARRSAVMVLTPRSVMAINDRHKSVAWQRFQDTDPSAGVVVICDNVFTCPGLFLVPLAIQNKRIWPLQVPVVIAHLLPSNIAKKSDVGASG